MATVVIAPPGFVIMWNMPGYLPETDPLHVPDFPSAVEALVSELETLELNAETDAVAAEYAEMADAVAAWDAPDAIYGPSGDPYVYSIVRVTDG